MTGDGVTDEGRSKRRKVENIDSFNRSNSLTSSSILTSSTSVTSSSDNISNTATIDSNQVQDTTGVTPAVCTSTGLTVGTSLTVADAVHTAGSNASTKYPSGTSPQNSSAQTPSLAANGSAHTAAIISAPKTDDDEWKLDLNNDDNDDDNNEADVDEIDTTTATQLDLLTTNVFPSPVPDTASHYNRPVVTPVVSSGSCVVPAPPSTTSPCVASPLYPLSGGRVNFTMKGLGGQARVFNMSMRPNVVLVKAMAAFGEKFGVDHKCLEFSCRGEVLTGDQPVSHVVEDLVLVRIKKGTGE